jgi:hypothetical protein
MQRLPSLLKLIPIGSKLGESVILVTTNQGTKEPQASKICALTAESLRDTQKYSRKDGQYQYVA